MDENNYVAPLNDGTGRFVVVVNGQSQGFYADQGEAERTFNYVKDGGAAGSIYQNPVAPPAVTPSPTPRPATPPTPTGPNPNSQQIVGGMAQLDPYYQQQQIALQLRRLQELEIPGLDLQKQAQNLTTAQGLAGLTGYIDPAAWQAMTGQTISGRQNTLSRDQLIEQQRQFDAAQKQQGQQFYAGLLGSHSGPRDYLKMQMDQAYVPQNARTDDLMSIWGNQPAFGAMKGDPSNSWESMYRDYMQRQSGQGGLQQVAGGGSYSDPMSRVTPPGANGTGIFALPPEHQKSLVNYGANVGFQGGPVSGTGSNVGFQGGPASDTSNPKPWFGSYTQPNQIGTSQYANMKPSQKAMLEGQWAAAGLDPADAWDTMRKSQPQGTANTRTYWR